MENITLGPAEIPFYYLIHQIKSEGQDDYEWFSVLSKLSECYVSIPDIKIEPYINFFIEKDPSHLLKLLYKTETKKYPKKLRIELYNKLIALGLLDYKIARRIRSDSSSTVSVKVLATLFENRSKYSIENFHNLVTQFADTNHKWVAQYIAINIPLQLAPFLMGISDSSAKKILEKRMYI